MSDDECQPHDEFARVRYRPGMYLTADDMAMEQNYLLHKLASINKALFEPGIVGGPDSFAVTVCEHDTVSIEISAGNAIDPDGILLEFGGTHAPLPARSELGPLPEGAAEDSCYVYALYRARETGESRIADGVQVIFSRSPQTQGVLLAKLLFEEDKVAEVKTDSSSRCYAASRLFSTK
ncbi:hypothetical protein DWV00_19085 [Trinickia dinghuensis]|uniref:Uncharacterized protein n=2 Tax=Trinickia dinghuensis TaxID=2291023 RepID=A0A3D8JXG5_9BURK|nr:hypothetical protein DWV00_19085 [Trinickia dinghuensis]